MEMRVALLGCGNVGRALIALVAKKEQALLDERDLTLRFSGGSTRRAGAWIAPAGLTAAQLAASDWPTTPGAIPTGAKAFTGDGVAFAAQAPADVIAELTTLNPQDGQPALDYVRAALTAGKHVATANKGPIAHGLRELRALSQMRGVGLRFESTVMDGTPIFGMMDACLPATDVLSFRGLLNSTSNYVLWCMGQGQTLEEAVTSAQRLGVAEADPSNDLDGWDASVKATVLANALMGANLRPQQVNRVNLGALAMKAAQAELQPGYALKQVVEGRRENGENGQVVAEVRLRALPPDDVFSHMRAMETVVRLTTDTLGELTLIEGDKGEEGPTQTAMGVLADIVALARAYPR